APTTPRTATCGTSRRGRRRRDRATGPVTAASPTATPVQRSAASSRGPTPASRATLAMLALAPNSTAAAVTWARPRRARAGASAAAVVVRASTVGGGTAHQAGRPPATAPPELG